jgi:fibronectin-binding autotransporter adhesin
MLMKLHNLPLILALALAWATPQAMAQYYWDVSTNSGIQNGNGTWGTDNFWASTSAGTNNVAWATNQEAWFGGNSTSAGSPTGNFTITVSGTQISAGIRQIQLGAGNFTLTGGEIQASFFRADTNTLTVNSVIGSYTNVANAQVSFSAQPAAGTLLILGGNNTFTNNVSIAGASSGGGTVRLNHQNALGLGNSVLWVHNTGLDLNGFTITNKTITVNDSRTVFLVNSGAGNAVWSGNVVLTNTPGNVGFRAGGTNGEVEVTGVISGTSNNSVQSFDGGRLRLSGTNTYDGSTSVRDNSTLIVGNASALGSTVSGTFINTGATLDLNGFNVGNEAITLQQTTSRLVNSNTTTAATVVGGVTLGATSSGTGGIGGEGNLSIAGVVSGAFGFSKIGAGTLTLSDSNTYSGTTTASAGTLALSGSGTLGAGTNALTISGGNVDLGGLSRNVGAFTLSTGTLANGTLTATNYALTSAGSISATLAGSGGLTKSGAATATLSGDNTYSGTTTISGGGSSTLRLGHTNALGSGTNVQYTAQSFLDLNGFSISGKTLAVNAAATGFLINTTATKSTWAGDVLLTNSGGSVRAGGTNAEVEISGNISGSGSLTAYDNSTLRLSGNNSFTGGAQARSGSTLIVGHANALGGSTSATNFIGQTATFDLNGFDIGNRIINFQRTDSKLVNNNTNSTAAVGGPMIIGQSTCVIGGPGNITLSGVISSTTNGGFSKTGAGTLTLSGTNTYSGSTTVSNGSTLVLATNGSLRFVIGGSGTNNAVLGSGTTAMNGQFAFDLASASTNTNATWTIVAGTLTNTYGTNFLVTGFSGSGGNWTNTTNGVDYVFAQSNGVLSVKPASGVTPYNAWVAFWQTNSAGFTNTAGTNDPDADLFDNNEEFAFDGNPTIGSPALLTATKVGTNAVFNYVALTNTNAVTYAVQSTTNLTAGWTNAAVTISNSLNQSNISQTNSYLRKEFTVPASGNAFYRVQAAILP